MRTSRDCPAGMVTSPPEAEFAMLFAGIAAAAGAERPAAPVNVSATASVVLKVWTSPLISKRKTACVPPRYFPFNTRPSLNSKVSAAAAPAKNIPKTTATKKRFTLFIVPSHDRKSQFPETSASISPPKALCDSTALNGGNGPNGCAMARMSGNKSGKGQVSTTIRGLAGDPVSKLGNDGDKRNE